MGKHFKVIIVVRSYDYLLLGIQTAMLLIWIGYVCRDPLDSPQVNRNNRSNSLYLKLRCLFLFRTWDVTRMEDTHEACVVLYLAQGSYNTSALGLVCLHYIITTNATSALCWQKLVWCMLRCKTCTTIKSWAVDWSTIQFWTLLAKGDSIHKLQISPFINNLKILGCATNQDVLLLATLRYIIKIRQSKINSRSVAGPMGQMNCGPSVWCSKYYFFSWFLAEFFAKILSIYLFIFFKKIQK